MAKRLYYLVCGGQIIDTKQKFLNIQNSSILDQIGGSAGNTKKKRVRFNVLSRATKRTTRCVISNNPTIDIDEVMIDRKVATQIMMTEVITPFNIEYV
jgi:hypothetical protein